MFFDKGFVTEFSLSIGRMRDFKYPFYGIFHLFRNKGHALHTAYLQSVYSSLWSITIFLLCFTAGIALVMGSHVSQASHRCRPFLSVPALKITRVDVYSCKTRLLAHRRVWSFTPIFSTFIALTWRNLYWFKEMLLESIAPKLDEVLRKGKPHRLAENPIIIENCWNTSLSYRAESALVTVMRSAFLPHREYIVHGQDVRDASVVGTGHRHREEIDLHNQEGNSGHYLHRIKRNVQGLMRATHRGQGGDWLGGRRPINSAIWLEIVRA